MMKIKTSNGIMQIRPYLEEADDIWMVKTLHGGYFTRQQTLRSLVQLRLVNYLDGNLEEKWQCQEVLGVCGGGRG